jgi:hypothetical protein
MFHFLRRARIQMTATTNASSSRMMTTRNGYFSPTLVV